jgi:uncharacterized protein (DUF1499 family)
MTVGLSMVAVLSALAVLTAVVVRRAPDEPHRWHVDPLTAAVSDKPNWLRMTPEDAPVDHERKQEEVAPRYEVPVERLAATFDEVAMGEERVQRLAGSVDQGWVTYQQRSAVFGFPDYVSVRFLEVGPGASTLAVYSRARYGRGDGGVNAHRVHRWVEQTSRRLR